jgi:hypothetical protein
MRQTKRQRKRKTKNAVLCESLRFFAISAVKKNATKTREAHKIQLEPPYVVSYKGIKDFCRPRAGELNTRETKQNIENKIHNI